MELLWWRFTQSIPPEVKDFGDENETNYETDEINKENMKEFCIFIADQKSENTKHTTKYKQISCRFWSKEERAEGSKRRTFFYSKSFIKEKNSVVYKPSTLTYFQWSVQWHVDTKGSTVNLLKEDGFKLLKFLVRC